MFSALRKHFSYANVVATLALLFAMSGGALAAKHYLVNSTKQINPKVLKQLRGRAGKRGPSGPAGGAGPTGPTGASGPFAAYQAFGGEEASLNLPAGNYFVVAHGTFSNNSGKVGMGVCELLPHTGLVADYAEASVPSTGEETLSHEAVGKATVANNATIGLSVAGTITEKCITSEQSVQVVHAMRSQIDAIPVNAAG